MPIRVSALEKDEVLHARHTQVLQLTVDTASTLLHGEVYKASDAAL